ncbi:hypothetical protein [Halorussus caseinilyticus]|uniref:Uncharacterized protein n=1 Tax=Halorussus caseinilyticus TaxID=3034025 RepID=A0ABD5WJ46_9EURY|nr:hypothetical protein [Halorussus sp. DT72]
MVGPAQKVGILVETAVFLIAVLLVVQLLELSGLQGIGVAAGLLAVLLLFALFTRLSFTLFDVVANRVGKTRNALRHRRE